MLLTIKMQLEQFYYENVYDIILIQKYRYNFLLWKYIGYYFLMKMLRNFFFLLWKCIKYYFVIKNVAVTLYYENALDIILLWICNGNYFTMKMHWILFCYVNVVGIILLLKCIG